MKIIARNWHRALAALALGACLWTLAETGRSLAASAKPSGAEDAVRIVRDALAETAPSAEAYIYSDPPPDYSGHARAALACNGYGAVTLAPVAPHFVYPLAPRRKAPPRDIEDRQARFGPPVIENAEARHGGVELVLAQNPEDEHVGVLRFELFRRKEGGSYAGEPLAVIEPGADARAAFVDREVEPNARYEYRARAMGVAERPGSVGGDRPPGGGDSPPRPGKEIRIAEPPGVEHVRLGELDAWLTPFSPGAFAYVPGDVELEIAGTVGDPPWAARVRVRQWNAEFNKWDEATFTIDEGEAIAGGQKIRQPTGEEWVQFESAHVLLKVEHVLEERKILELVFVVSVPRITVRETATGKTYFIGPKDRPAEDSAAVPPRRGSEAPRPVRR